MTYLTKTTTKNKINKNSLTRAIVNALGVATCAATLSFSIAQAEEKKLTDLAEAKVKEAVVTVENKVEKSVEKPLTITSSASLEKQQLVKQELIAILDTIEQVNAAFSQTVIDADGNLIQESEGQLALVKPNRVRWHTQTPEETLIVSDGKTLWFFDPFIEQVTAHSLDNAIANTPILLLTSRDESLWQQYQVSKNDNSAYVVSSLDPDAQVKQLSLSFTTGEVQKLKSFTITDSTGQKSNIDLVVDAKQQPLADDAFTFEVPEGIYLDDQR